MKKTKKRRVFRWYIPTLVVLVLVAGYVVTARVAHFWPFSSVAGTNSDASRNEHVSNPSPKNPAIPDKSSLSNSTSDGDKTSNEIPVSTAMKATITRLDETGSEINFTADVTGATTAGTCVLTLSNPNDRPVTKQFAATYSTGTAHCGPTQISAYEFSYLGQWQASLRYYEGSQQATTAGSIDIK